MLTCFCIVHGVLSIDVIFLYAWYCKWQLMVWFNSWPESFCFTFIAYMSAFTHFYFEQRVTQRIYMNFMTSRRWKPTVTCCLWTNFRGPASKFDSMDLFSIWRKSQGAVSLVFHNRWNLLLYQMLTIFEEEEQSLVVLDGLWRCLSWINNLTSTSVQVLSLCQTERMYLMYALLDHVTTTVCFEIK